MQSEWTLIINSAGSTDDQFLWKKKKRNRKQCNACRCNKILEAAKKKKKGKT